MDWTPESARVKWRVAATGQYVETTLEEYIKRNPQDFAKEAFPALHAVQQELEKLSSEEASKSEGKTSVVQESSVFDWTNPDGSTFRGDFDAYFRHVAKNPDINHYLQDVLKEIELEDTSKKPEEEARPIFKVHEERKPDAKDLSTKLSNGMVGQLAKGKGKAAKGPKKTDKIYFADFSDHTTPPDDAKPLLFADFPEDMLPPVFRPKEKNDSNNPEHQARMDAEREFTTYTDKDGCIVFRNHPLFNDHKAQEATIEIGKGTKLDNDRPRFDLIPPLALEAVGKVLAFGAKKYAPYNWMGLPKYRLLRAVEGHLNAAKASMENDDESSEPHLVHALCSLLMLVELQLLRPEEPLTEASQIYADFNRRKGSGEGRHTAQPLPVDENPL